MTRHVQRDELVDFVTWKERRPGELPVVLEAKAVRRVHLAHVLTFLFENRLTVRYQVQEMMRVEQIVREADILHELQTYNELLGAPGDLGCTLLIELPPAVRDDRLRALRGLPDHLYVRLADGRRVGARFDPRQVGDDRLSSVQYLQFPTDGEAPVALGSDHAELVAEVALGEATRAALAADLAP